MIGHIYNSFTFICGVGMFLYGMKMMSEGLQKVVSNKLSNVLKFLTKNKFMGIIVGAIVTIITHSSAATTVMVVGFVNAGILKLTEAIGVIMGANLGTTLTAWIVALAELGEFVEVLKPEFFAPIIFGSSALIFVFTKREKIRNTSNIFVGVGLLFIGLTYMASGVSPYSSSQLFRDSFEVLGKNPLLAVIVGVVVTFILSSSTASMSILQTLALAGAVSKMAAVFIIMGQNIGSCLTTILSSLNGSKNGKRAALLHLLFNVVGSIIFSIFIAFSYYFIKDFLNTRISLFEIAAFHTGFNLANTIILFPFSGFLVFLSERLIVGKGEDEEDYNLPEKTQAILDSRILTHPALAISTTKNEIIFYANFTLKNLRRAVNLILKDRNEDLINNVVAHEDQIDKTTNIIVTYLAKIDNLNISEAEHMQVEHLISACSDIERIGDHAENISECAERMMEDGVKFSDEAMKEMRNFVELSLATFENAINCLKDLDMDMALLVRKYETEVDGLEDVYRDNHIKRMSSGKCDMLAGIIFLDIIGNLERVTDHSNNLADYVEAEINQKVLIDRKTFA